MEREPITYFGQDVPKGDEYDFDEPLGLIGCLEEPDAELERHELVLPAVHYHHRAMNQPDIGHCVIPEPSEQADRQIGIEPGAHVRVGCERALDDEGAGNSDALLFPSTQSFRFSI
jgi:hypothetical protein